MNTVNTAISQLKAIIATTQASQVVRKSILECKHQYPANINHVKQKFFSTKKKRVKKTLTLSKPSVSELNASQAKLDNQEPSICAVCWKTDDIDITYSQVEVNWVQCSNCFTWIHKQCVLKLNESTEIGDDYYCMFCS